MATPMHRGPPLDHPHPEEARPSSAPRTSLNWPALRSVSPKTAKPALAGVPLGGLLQFVGRPGSHHSSEDLLAVEPVPPCTGVTRLPPARRKPPRGGTRAPPRRGRPLLRDRAWRRGRRHRARGPALAPSDAGFALADSPWFVGDHPADPSARRASLATSRPLTRAARREWRSARCRRGRAGGPHSRSRSPRRTRLGHSMALGSESSGGRAALRSVG